MRTRRKRTVFSAQQLRVLEKFFEGKRYMTYEERETLAARLNLEEYQVKVWLKNRRAKDRRLQRMCGQQGQGAHATMQQEPELCVPQPVPVPAPEHAPARERVRATVPAPSPAPPGPVIQWDPVLPASPLLPTPVFPEKSDFLAGPVLPAGPVLCTIPVLPAAPVFPAANLRYESQGFCNLSPKSPWKAPGKSSQEQIPTSRQASWDLASGTQGTFSSTVAPAPVPAPAPDPHPSKATVSPQGPDAGNFSPDPDFTELLSPYCPLEEPSSSPRAWYDFVGDSEVDLFQLLDLQMSPSPPSPADAGHKRGPGCAPTGVGEAPVNASHPEVALVQNQCTFKHPPWEGGICSAS